MKILFTGASSFSGMWFVKGLIDAGHDLTITYQHSYEKYQGLRRQRIDKLLSICKPAFNCSFGSDAFNNLIDSSNNWDLFCHHASDVNNYKSPYFDFAAALTNNTKNIKVVLEKLKARHCQKVLLTGSVFEQREGLGTDDLRAVSPYGLSKGLTSDVFSYYTNVMSMKLGKFVIPNPFGPFEEPRYSSFLAQNWFQGKIAPVNSPEYTRDNIPISLLAKAYVDFASKLTQEPGLQKYAPSYLPETQGQFTQRFAMELRTRLQLPCEYLLNKQVEFSEPKVRINIDKLDIGHLGWSPDAFWDELAEFYQTVYQPAVVS